MASKSSIQITARDEWMLTLLQLGPLDLHQLLRASQGTPWPYPTADKIARRLRRLDEAGYVRTYQWDVRLPGTLNYYRSTKLGRRIVTAEAARDSLFKRLSVTDQKHAYYTGAVLAATIDHAGRLGLPIREHTGDRQFEARVPGQSEIKPLKPDGRMILEAPERRLELWDEIDLHTESIGGLVFDSLERKVRFHAARRLALPAEDYLVRVFFRERGPRMERFLTLAARYAERNTFIFLATTIDDYCSDPAPLTSKLFVDHSGRPRRLYKRPKTPRNSQRPLLEEVRDSLAEPALV